MFCTVAGRADLDLLRSHWKVEKKNLSVKCLGCHYSPGPLADPDGNGSPFLELSGLAQLKAHAGVGGIPISLLFIFS